MAEIIVLPVPEPRPCRRLVSRGGGDGLRHWQLSPLFRLLEYLWGEQGRRRFGKVVAKLGALYDEDGCMMIFAGIRIVILRSRILVTALANAKRKTVDRLLAFRGEFKRVKPADDRRGRRHTMRIKLRCSIAPDRRTLTLAAVA